MLKQSLFSLLITSTLYGVSAQEYKQQLSDKFISYKKNQQTMFEDYIQKHMKAFKDYKQELSKFWDDPILSSQKNWVTYTEDKKTRSNVDFKNEEIIIETIASSEQEAKAKLQIALAKSVVMNNKSAHENDPLEKRLSKIKKPAGVIDAKVSQEPILAPLIFKKPPTKESLVNYVNKHVNSKNIKVVQSTKVKHTKIYSIKVKMPHFATIKRSKIYEEEVRKQASRQNLPVPLVFAIMHSESSFNPRARSHIPAFGLMQIVPKTAGIDTYQYLYKKKKLISGNYLYNATNNITMGSGYLHILYYKYLKSIKNPDSKLYCTIAAYNTGVGNIAYAFNRHKNLNKKQMYRMKYAADDINALTPNEVYAKLMKDLRWDEPKHYLKKVSSRMSIYHKIYGL